MGGQRVVVLAVTEGRRRAAGLIRGHDRPVAPRTDAVLHRLHPGVVLPRLGPYPLGIATLDPATGVALAQSSSSGSGAASLRERSEPIASITSCSAARLWPLTSESTKGSAAAIPPTRGEKPSADTRGLTQTIRYASRARRSISRATSA